MEKKVQKPGAMAEQVIEIAERAGRVLMSYFQKNIEVQLKNKDAFDPVTRADLESDRLIRDSLTKLFPNDSILSEENTAMPTRKATRIWMVDPLDGTKDFIKGKDSFGIHIGLLKDNQIVFGLVFAPARKRLFFAEKGKGAFEWQRDGSFKRIHVSRIQSLAHAHLITRSPGKDERPIDKLVEKLKVKTRIHDSGIKVPRIAAGEAEAHLNSNLRASKWDTLAPQIILEEAGGVMTDMDGKPLDYGQPDPRWVRSYIAANNPKILNQILEAVRKAKL